MPASIDNDTKEQNFDEIHSSPLLLSYDSVCFYSLRRQCQQQQS